MSRDIKVDVVDMKLGFTMQYRSFPNGEREGEWGRRIPKAGYQIFNIFGADPSSYS